VGGEMATTPMPQHHELPSGARVRLRHPVRADADGLRALVGEEEAAGLLRFDPRRRAVVCAVDFEEVVGVGAIALQRDAAPDLVAVAPRHGEPLADVLETVLRSRAQACRRGVAQRHGFPVRALRRIARRP